MGYEEVPGTKYVSFKDFSAGWFPGKDTGDIPGSLTNEDQPIGATDSNAVVWLSGKLQKMFGYDNVNAAALNGGATLTSLFASEVISQFVATAGNIIYSGANNVAPTNITGAVTITAGNHIHWAEWQFETDAYIVGVNGVDAPIKWTGAGNADVLGGTPPRWQMGCCF